MMRARPLDLPGLALVEFQRFKDERGWFSETFSQRAFDTALAEAGLPPSPPFVQDNHSLSGAEILRGLHFQMPPFAQGKLVRVVRGRIFDVAVDIRARSASFGRWFGIELSADMPVHFWIPPGFAHGFCTFGEGAEVIYKTTQYYAPKWEQSLVWNDPDIGIAWPGHIPFSLSSKDRAAPSLAIIRQQLSGVEF